ncbi:hypothetical protein F5884DRAFT_31334 [Xylogone sp. PMI_703]|nr:hypothetical protein F5884DRAFT_31334 [Xylogone sp. PMI_703]
MQPGAGPGALANSGANTRAVETLAARPFRGRHFECLVSGRIQRRGMMLHANHYRSGLLHNQEQELGGPAGDLTAREATAGAAAGRRSRSHEGDVSERPTRCSSERSAAQQTESTAQRCTVQTRYSTTTARYLFRDARSSSLFAAATVDPEHLEALEAQACDVLGTTSSVQGELGEYSRPESHAGRKAKGDDAGTRRETNTTQSSIDSKFTICLIHLFVLG